MKTNSHDDENTNLVMFPASKNFKISLSAVEIGIDPLEELLGEYAHFEEKDLPDYLDERFENGLDDSDSDSFDSLEAFMNRNQRQDVLTPDDLLARLINEKIDAIAEARARIKYYLDEIEMFLPNRRK